MALPPDFDSHYKILSQQRYLKMVLGAGGGIHITKMSLPERLLKSVTRRVSSQFSVWKLAWAEFGRGRSALWMKHGAGIVAWLLFTGAGQSAYAAAHYIWPFLPWYGWLLTFLGTTILAQMFVIHYSSIAYERIRREEVEALEDRIWELLDSQQPILAIDYRPEEGAPFVQTGGGTAQYRVSVRCPVVVPDVELVVNHLKLPDLPPLFDLHLRPMGESRVTKRVALKASKEMFWDLICIFEFPQGSDLVHLTYTPASLSELEFRPGEYVFELMATGGERPGVTKIVNLTVDTNHKVTSLELRDGRLSSPI